MPRLQTLLGALNTAFSRSEIAQTAHGRDSFAPGQPLGDALAGMVASLGSPMYLAFRDYVAMIPGSIQESIRSSLHYALSTDPPTLSLEPGLRAMTMRSLFGRPLIRKKHAEVLHY